MYVPRQSQYVPPIPKQPEPAPLADPQYNFMKNVMRGTFVPQRSNELTPVAPDLVTRDPLEYSINQLDDKSPEQSFTDLKLGGYRAPATAEEKEMQSLQKRLKKVMSEGMSEQRKGIKDTESRLNKLKEEGGAGDYSIFAALSDMFTGSNLTGQLQRQEREKAREIAGLERLLANQRQGLARTELDSLRTQLQGAQMRGLRSSKGFEAVDRAFGKDYAKWVGGGFASVQGNLSKLKSALGRLQDPNSELGSVLMPESIRARTNPESVAIEQDIGNVVFQSLKEILGGQFTEKEGQKLVQQTYDPRLSDVQNARKVQDALTKLQNLAQAKQQATIYFQDRGTLEGFQGSDANTIEDFLRKKKDELFNEADAEEKLVKRLGL